MKVFLPFISYIPATTGFLLLAGLIFFRNTQAWVNRYFALFALCAAGWMGSTFVAVEFASPSLSLWALRTAAAFATAMTPFFLLFVEQFPLFKRTYSKDLQLALVAGAGLLTALSFTGLSITGLIFHPGDVQPAGFGPVYYLQVLFIIGGFAASLHVLRHKGKRLTKLQKRQVSLVSRALLLAILINATNNLVLGAIGDSGRYADLLAGLSLFVFACVTAYMIAITKLATTVESAVKKGTASLKKINEELKQLDALKDDFMSMASHQLRSPATSVREALRMLSDSSLGKEEQGHLLALAETSSERLVSVVKNMLNVAELQAGYFSLNKTRVNLSGLTEQSIDQLSSAANQKEIILKFTKPGATFARADKIKLGEAMTNLVDNAVKYSPAGSTVTVRLKTLKGRVIFEVLDEGIGVPKAATTKLFTKFYRANNSGKDGHGVGLFVVKNIAEAHGGKAYYKPLKNGSLFGFWLPK